MTAFLDRVVVDRMVGDQELILHLGDVLELSLFAAIFVVCLVFMVFAE